MRVNWIEIFLFVYLGTVLFLRLRPMVRGTNFRGTEWPVGREDVELFHDVSWWEGNERKCTQSISREIFRMIERAEKFLLIDMFLLTPNLEGSPDDEKYLPVTRQAVKLLVRKKKERPDMPVYFITDPVNGAYGTFEPEALAVLRMAGVKVIVTDIEKLRDGNYLYSALWLLFIKWFGVGKNGWIPHPMEDVDKKVTVRAFAKALRAKANHRKVVIADDGGEWFTLVTSMNLHESSCWHSNVAVKIRGRIAEDALRTEKDVAVLSKTRIDYDLVFPERRKAQADTGSRVQLLTEAKIRQRILEDFAEIVPGTRIAMTTLYLSDPDIHKALIDAARQGCDVEVVLDNNSEAFGQPKLGLPNQITAQKLLKRSGGRIRVRMARSRHEQLHAKMLFFSRPDLFILYAGSANFTTRNIGGFTLETNVRAEGRPGDDLAKDAEIFFNLLGADKFSYPVDRKPKFYWLKAFLYNFQQVFRLTTY